MNKPELKPCPFCGGEAIRLIEFLSGSWQCVRKYTDKGRENEYSYLHRLEYDNPNQYEVIGNIHDNADLLGENNAKEQ